MDTLIETKFNVNHKGVPVVNNVTIEYKDYFVVLLSIDMKTKYCKIEATGEDNLGNPEVWIGTPNDKDKISLISFPEFPDYDVYATSSGRYTIKVCLFLTIKEQ